MLDRKHVEELYSQPLKDLLREASRVHLENFSSNEVQLSQLVSIKTGGCSEDCSYCPQSAHYKTQVPRTKMMTVAEIRETAQRAHEAGAMRFCMGAAWREVNDGRDFDAVLEMVREVKSFGLEVCCTLGMLNESQALRLKNAGLDAYNHNIDSSRGFYSKIISTREYDERLRTIENVRRAGLTVCTGGIIGMGESHEDRIDFLFQLASFEPYPESVTVNSLIPIEGTPLQRQMPATPLELARVIAVARCLMPTSMIRLSAGRKSMSDEGQFLCFLAGVNSIFIGDTLLTSPNPSLVADLHLLQEAGLKVRSLELST